MSGSALAQADQGLDFRTCALAEQFLDAWATLPAEPADEQTRDGCH